MMLKIYLIGHGETDFNKQSKEWDQDPNILLNDFGLAQSRKLVEKMKCIKFDKLYSSDIERAMQTTEILNKEINLQIIKDKRLREYDPGEVDPSPDRWIEKYKGSTIDVFADFVGSFQIPSEWKISEINEEFKRYEIGKIKISGLKHKVNLTVPSNKIGKEADSEILK